MHSSFNEYGWQPNQVQKLKVLLGCEDLRILTKQGGGNSVVFCIEANEKKWAVKSYPPYAAAQRDRLAAELMVYQFFNQKKIPAVPLLKAYSESERWLIIDWIEGQIPTHYAKPEIDQALYFLRSIERLNELPESIQLPHAAEACVSLTILQKQIEQRLQRLLDLPEKDVNLTHFLLTIFCPIFEACLKRAKCGYQAKQLDPNAELPQHQRSLIPADFGFHNTICDKTGKLFFFDFDYFGWDDPVKLLADILWHPKMHLSDAQKQQFIQGMAAVYHKDPTFLSRFYYTWPLFGLRWVLILLNEFIPAFWQNRQHANVHQNLAEAKRVQLKRAAELLQQVQQIGNTYEYVATTSL